MQHRKNWEFGDVVKLLSYYFARGRIKAKGKRIKEK